MNENQAIYFFHQGTNYFSYRFMGAHYQKDKTTFRVWAPNAMAVHVVGDFNYWSIFAHPMNKINTEGIWEVVIPDVLEYMNYQFAILTKDRKWIYKSDPFAFHAEKRPKYASKVYNTNDFQFSDQAWMHNRLKVQGYDQALNIYELHLGSWRKYEDGNFFNYRKLGIEIADYVKEMGYTHIEIMPINEHPLDASWGYQVTGYFAITSRFGTPADFKAFVDICHSRGIGVIVDWVPGHFCKDAHGLIEFDGRAVYEDANPNRQEHDGWGTRIFDFGKPEIQSFLVSSAMYLLEEFHIDGLRVDAVASMLYLDYGRDEFEANHLGTNINLEALAFIKKLNSSIKKHQPGVLMIAEESTTYPNITTSVEEGGLGFDYKWNMGWMNDTLFYLKKDPIYRKWEHHKITFQMTYIYQEHFILALSHDEVVHGKLSLLNKMPGSYEEKFRGYRTYLMYMMSHPGKKLNFMGSEIGQFIEWDEDREIDWLLLAYEKHHDLQLFIKNLNHFYLNNPALYVNDQSWTGFAWVNADDEDHNVYIYQRLGGNDIITVICNFSNQNWSNYEIYLETGKYEIVFASEILEVKSYQAIDNKLQIDLPPLCGIYLRKEK